MEGPVTAGIALLGGGAAVTAVYLWQSQQQVESRLWAISNGFESWLHIGGGTISAIIGGLILIDHFV